MCELICAFAIKKFLEFLKANFKSNITPKKPEISPITKFHKRFNVCSHLVSGVMPIMRKMKTTRHQRLPYNQT